ncbi:hypothetical protein [Shewanella xiamenensis]|uniref:hypothetical protein n=1 Tax=Shewanella xiamenensis TaxID=332186 RepID=UPI00313CA8D4
MDKMAEIAIGQAVCIDKSNDFFGRIFFKHPDGMWVDESKATRLEMALAISRKAMIESSSMQQSEFTENQLSDNSYANIPHTPEEDAEFARIERNQDIALLANVIRTSPTTSAEAIAARVLDAGYQFSGSAVRLK